MVKLHGVNNFLHGVAVMECKHGGGIHHRGDASCEEAFGVVVVVSTIKGVSE